MVEIMWVASTLFMVLAYIGSPDRSTIGLLIPLLSISTTHYILGRSLPKNLYWVSAACMCALTASLGLEMWQEPTGSRTESILTSLVFAFFVAVCAIAFRPTRLVRSPSDSEPIGPVAFDEELTVRVHRHFCLLHLGLTIVGIAILTVAVSSIIQSENQTEDLELNGHSYVGTVQSVHRQTRIVVGFTDYSADDVGHTRVEEITLDKDTEEYQVGQEVEVLVDRTDPTVSTIRGESNESYLFGLLASFGLVFGVLAALTGLLGMRRARRQRRLFESEPWREVRFEHVARRSGRHHRNLLKIIDGTDEHVVRMAATNGLVVASGHLTSGGACELVGDCDRHGVIRLPHHPRIFHISAPRTQSVRNRWLSDF